MTRKILNPVTVASLTVIVYMAMPILAVIISTYVTTYAYMLLTVFLAGFIMLYGGIKRLNTIIRMFAPFFIYIGCTFFKRGNSTLLWGYQSLLFLLPALIGFYYMNYRSENINVLSKVLIIALFVTSITTIIGLIQFPNASRILATIATSDNAEALKYHWHNIGGYDFVYICVLLYPMLILAHKLRRINRITFFIVFALLLALIIISEYTIALLLFIISSILYFSGKRLTAQQLLALGIFIFILLFVFWDYFKEFLLWLANIISSDSVSDRLTALAGGVEGLENFEDNRLQLYTMSLSSFFKSPLFGQLFSSTSYAGGHSFILDSLASYGILGGTTLFFIYRSIYKFFFMPLHDAEGFGFVLWSFVQVIILSTVNTGMWINVLALFIPTILYLIYNTNDEDKYENSLDS